MTAEERRADAQRGGRRPSRWTPLERTIAYLVLNTDYDQRMGEIGHKIERLARDETRP